MNETNVDFYLSQTNNESKIQALINHPALLRRATKASYLEGDEMLGHQARQGSAPLYSPGITSEALHPPWRLTSAARSSTAVVSRRCAC